MANPSSSFNAPNSGYSVSTTSSMFVCPNIASMDASGNATYNTTSTQQQAVSIAGIDQVFACETADDAQSAKLLNCFTVSGYGSGAGVDASNNELSVVVDAKADFQEVLIDAIERAIAESNSAEDAAAGVSSTNANDFMTDGLKADLDALLLRLYAPQTTRTGVAVTNPGDEMANTVKGLLRWDSVSVVLDSSGGAANMWDDLAAVPADVRSIYLQIPEATQALYLDANDNPNTAALPMQKGDTLTFVFNVSSNAVAFHDAGNAETDEAALNPTPDAGVSQSQVPESGYVRDANQLHLSYTGPARRLAFKIKIKGESGPVSGLKAAPAPATTQA
jgi:hypothetical protein